MGTYNHTGQVVTDLERSKRFYQEVFGFAFWYEITPPDDPTAKLSGLTPPLGITASLPDPRRLRARADALRRAGRHRPVPAPHDERARAHPPVDLRRRRAGQWRTGRSSSAVEIIEESDLGVALFVRDPDGQLIELLPVSYRDGLPPKP